MSRAFNHQHPEGVLGKPGWGAIAGRLAIYVLFFFLILIPSSFVMHALLNLEAASPVDYTLWLSPPLLAAALAANWFCLLRFEHSPLETLGLQCTTQQAKNLGWGFMAGAAPVGAAALGGWIWGLVTIQLDTQPVNVLDMLRIVILMLTASTSEEILVRGYPFQLLLRKTGFLSAVILTGLFFAFGHSGNPSASVLSLLNTFVAGVGLGFAFWRTGSLWFPIGLHAGWNLALVALSIPVSGVEVIVSPVRVSWNAPDWFAGGAYGIEGGVLGSAAFLLWAPLTLLLPLHRTPPPLLRQVPQEKPEQ